MIKSVLNIIKDVELKDNSKVNLVEIRNPSGSSQWKGRFSDTDSQSWSNIVNPNIRCMKLGLVGNLLIVGGTTIDFIGYIDVGDGCWRPNVLVTSLRCW